MALSGTYALRGLAERAAPRSSGPRYGAWVAYSGLARPVLAAVLFTVAALLVWWGNRLHRPLRVPVPGRTTTSIMLAVWILSIVTFFGCVAVYVAQLRRAHVTERPPMNPITPVTLSAVVVTLVVLVISAPEQAPRRLPSAVIGALAAPMIFEFPFDLIVMSRTYPPVPPHPGLYRALIFLPLLLVDLTTIWLLTLSPAVAIRPRTCRLLAAMFAVFGVWALFGFGFPGAPAPVALNLVSKLLAFATALSLFLPRLVTSGASGADQLPRGGHSPVTPSIA
jgi:hypothetical protein